MSISASAGVGSGIDINGLVSQLVQADGQPALNALNKKESSAKTRLSALGTFKSALAEFQTAVKKLSDGSAFKTQQVASSNEAFATVKTGTGAVSGSYAIEVMQMAKPQKNIGSVGYATATTPAITTAGALHFNSVNGKPAFDINLATGDNLANVRDKINTDTNAISNGIQASIINVDNGSGGTVSKLVLSSKNPGTANSFEVSSATGPATLLGLGETPTSAALDAKIKVDGQIASRSTNTLTDVIPGVTIDLKSVPTTATPFNIDVTLDTKSIKDAGQGFVDSYNKLQAVMKDLSKYDAATKKAGALNGDSTLRDVQTQIRGAVGSIVSSAGSTTNSLALIGMSIDKVGVMSLDSTKFDKVMNTNLNALSQVFSATDGVAAKLEAKLSVKLQSGGVFDTQTNNLNANLKTITKDRENVQYRLDKLEKTLLKQFQAMDSTVGKFKGTGSFLSQKFG